MNQSTKPAKPSADFPLFAHASGRWAKKINQKLYYFGKWTDDPEGKAAKARFEREYPYLSAGLRPPDDVTEGRAADGGYTLRDLANDFLEVKKDKLEAGDLSPVSFDDYYRTCKRLLETLGRSRRVDDLQPEDFRLLRQRLSKTLGVVALGNEINRCRIILRFADIEKGIRVAYGQHFAKPSAKQRRKVRNEAGPKLFSAEEIKQLLNAAGPEMTAMIYLGLNGGLGNADVALLPQSAIDWNGWLNYPRQKTAIERRIPLWPETLESLEAAIAIRPSPKKPEDGNLCFITRNRNPWWQIKPSNTSKDRHVKVDTVGRNFGRLLKRLNLNGRKGLGYYTLRHCFETVAGESKDQVAVDAIMGHVDPSMGANYRHGVSDERLRAVVNVVHQWLHG